MNDSTDPATTTESFGLSAIDQRILGSLIEKEATTPDTYPLTVNAALMACNQKTARDPIMHLEQGAVHHALRQLEVRGWVRSQHTARAERYAHRVTTRLGLTAQQTTILGLLLLRGPQTAHELLSRSERMAKFDDVEAVTHTLERLRERDVPLVGTTPRRPGQSSDRYIHLLGDIDLDGFDDAMIDVTDAASGQPSLRDRIAALEARVTQLEQQLTQTAPAPETQSDDA